MLRTLLLVLALALSAGCPGGGGSGDTGLNFDAGPGVDAMDAGTDSGTDAGMDTGPLPEESEATPPAQVEGSGNAIVLRGVVLTENGPIDGEVRIEGGMIECVAASCDHVGATVVQTNGVISPGLIDAHNHLPYNFIPEWVPDPMRLFDNRYVWADVAAYEAHVEPFAARRSTNVVFCPSALWGELRSLVHGTTTIMGQSFSRSCTNGGVRNADQAHRLGHDHLRTTIGSVRDLTDSDAASLVASFTEGTDRVTRYAVHMQEGVMGNGVLQEFESFAGRDTRNNRHAGVSLLSGNGYSGVGVLIHSMGLTEAQLMEVVDTGAHIVWSPSSNLILYGETAPVERMMELGLEIALSPDWTVSGEDNVLDEMRFARGYAIGQNIAMIDNAEIWRMVTSHAAEAVGLSQYVGVLREGMIADLTVFGRRAADPYRAVLDSQSQDVRLVLISGEAYYGDSNLSQFQVNSQCEAFDACGTAKFICVRNLPGAEGDWTGDNIQALEGQLRSIIGEYNVSYTEPLPLVACR